ncbi:probable disease resistance protein RPP1 [Cornus florida]|uniref:probable disease resistance protein RPP1 n=1 Tax=Cornus florida TaxID=4283 RepID=UPI0028A11B78|nr:probable disease resistance protein RPP1 [Cornus florida]
MSGWEYERGFRIFRVDKELERGKIISPELLKSINESRIAVIVFSKNYASSLWCLDELVEILECKRSKGQIILPLFYDVKPTDVKKQTGDFGEAFTRAHEGIRTANQMERWRTALKKVAVISGLELEDVANG